MKIPLPFVTCVLENIKEKTPCSHGAYSFQDTLLRYTNSPLLNDLIGYPDLLIATLMQDAATVEDLYPSTSSLTTFASIAINSLSTPLQIAIVTSLSRYFLNRCHFHKWFLLKNIRVFCTLFI
jgi:hypothetical protein